MPPMVIQAGPEAPQASGQSDEERAPAGDLGDYATVPKAGEPSGASATPSAGQSVEPSGDLGDYASVPKLNEYAAKPAFGGVGGLVRDDNGNYGIKESDGTMRELTEHERKAAHYLALGLRMSGGIGGSLVGGFAGAFGGGALAGPPGMIMGGIAGESAGAVGGDMAVHGLASEFERMAGEKPQEMSLKREALIGGSTLLGGIGGEAVAATAAGGARFAAEAGAGAAGAAEAAPTYKNAAGVSAEGKAAQGAQAAEGEAAVAQSGQPNIPQGIPQTPELKQGLQTILENKLKTIKSKYDAGVQSVAKQPLGEAVQGFRSDLGKQVEPLATRAAETARQRQFDTTELEAAFHDQLGLYLDKEGNLVPRDRIPDSKKGIAALYEQFQRETRAPVSTHGLGAKGGTVPEPLSQTPGSPPVYEAGPSTATYVPPTVEVSPEGVASAKPGFTVQSKPEVTRTPPGPSTIEMSKGADGSHTPFKPTAPTGAQELPPNEAGEARRGFTLSDMNRWLKNIEEEANFQGRNRTDGQYAAGQLYRKFRIKRDDITAQVFDEVGDKGSAKALRGSRDRFAKFSDDFDDMAQQIDRNPGEAAKILAKKGDFKQATTLAEGLPPAQFKALGMHIMDEIIATAREQGPQAASKLLDSWSPNVAKVYLSEGGYNAVKTQLNASQVLLGKLGPAATARGPIGAAVQHFHYAVRYPHYAAVRLAGEAGDVLIPSPAMRERILGANWANSGKVGAAIGAGTSSLAAPSVLASPKEPK